MCGDWSRCLMCCCILCVGTGCIAWHIAFLLQMESAGGNCLFAAIKASMNVHHSNSKDVPYYPTRYFRRQVVAWMIKHCQLVMANEGVALMANYGLEEEDGQFRGPLSYKQYLQHILQHCFWGDEIILYAISCMWNLWITVLNSRTLEEYQIWHSFSLADADVGIIYNCGSHYSAAGECWSHCWSRCSIYWSCCSIYWLCCWSPCMVNLLVTLLCISVCADEDLEKYVLETSKLCCSMFKLKCPADTEDEALVGISSEDEAEDMDFHHSSGSKTDTCSDCGNIWSPFSRSDVNGSCNKSSSWSWRGDREEGCSGHCAKADGCLGEGWGPPGLSTWGQRGSRCALCGAGSGRRGH